MTPKKSSDEELSPQEIEERFTRTVRRLLETPPMHKKVKKKPKKRKLTPRTK